MTAGQDGIASAAHPARKRRIAPALLGPALFGERATEAAGPGGASRGRVRLGTLINLRWLAVAGQSTALVFVYFELGYALPLTLCAAAVAASVVLNIILSVIYPVSHRVTVREAAAYLAYDIVQLAALLYLTGGIANPFALLFLAPVVISATTLTLTETMLLGTLAFGAITFLSAFHLPQTYLFGIWASLVLGIGFTSIYAWRTASEANRMSAALTASQLALARADRLAALGALAAAAAHELGTPLGTIAVVARELERELPPGTENADDFRLLRAEAERCGAILSRLAKPEEAVVGMADRLPLGALLDDLAVPHRGLDVAIAIHMQPGVPPKIWRVPELLHGLGNLIENAADFAAAKVSLAARWDDTTLCIDVLDDGPGFAPEILERLGEPYVTSRPLWRELAAREEAAGSMPEEGMGLGFFIAKTLIERTGGTVTARNRPEGGAHVTLRWPRGMIDGDLPPGTES